MYDNREVQNMVIKEEDITMCNNITSMMYTEIKFSQFFNNYTPRLLEIISNLRGFVNNMVYW